MLHICLKIMSNIIILQLTYWLQWNITCSVYIVQSMMDILVAKTQCPLSIYLQIFAACWKPVGIQAKWEQSMFSTNDVLHAPTDAIYWMSSLTFSKYKQYKRSHKLIKSHLSYCVTPWSQAAPTTTTAIFWGN